MYQSLWNWFYRPLVFESLHIGTMVCRKAQCCRQWFLGVIRLVFGLEKIRHEYPTCFLWLCYRRQQEDWMIMNFFTRSRGLSPIALSLPDEAWTIKFQ